ncbi:DUF6578 domain-containing protein [Streptosporangium fragile]|uniref:DUF6578 domain-containing protein n=1 Tax=Streptosporangium fragile TaxID=46186 RepID=UPI0031E5AFC0
MNLLVWVDGWQMECCGASFRVGSRIAWTLGPADADALTPVLGENTAATVDRVEDHHGDLPEDTPATEATVTAITAVHCRYAPRAHDDPRTLHPVNDSAVFSAVTHADGRTPDLGELQFVGYLVRLAAPRR